MSEESEFFRGEDHRIWSEQSRLSDATTPFWLPIIGGIWYSFSNWELPKRRALGFGVSVGGFLAALFVSRGMPELDRQRDDLNAAKVGLVPREQLYLRHVKLTPEQKEDLECAMAAEKKAMGWHVSNDPRENEQREERGLAAARAEWQRRVAMRAAKNTAREK